MISADGNSNNNSLPKDLYGEIRMEQELGRRTMTINIGSWSTVFPIKFLFHYYLQLFSIIINFISFTAVLIFPLINIYIYISSGKRQPEIN